MIEYESPVNIKAPLTVAGRVTSGLPDGGLSPFSIISQVWNENLNADQLDGYHAAAFPRKAENAAITGSWNFATAPTITTPGVASNSAATYGQITALSAIAITGAGSAGKLIKYTGALTAGVSIASEIGQSISIAGNAIVDVPSSAAGFGYFINTSGANRWFFGKFAAESGSNSGSNLTLSHFNDAGSQIGDVFFVNRSTGILTFSNVVKGVTPVSAADLVTKGFFDARQLTVAGTAGRISVSGGTQTLAADRTWTADLIATGIAAGTYRSATYDIYGRAITGTNPTTVAGYGITDILAQVVTGFTPSNSVIISSDSLLTAINKAQGQITGIATSVTGTSGVVAKFGTSGVVNSIMTETAGRITTAGYSTATHFESNPAPSASNAYGFSFQNGSSPRWYFGKLSLETGSNAGSDLYLSRYSDGGSWLGDVFNVIRSTGTWTFNSTVVGQTPTASNHLVIKSYVDARVSGTTNKLPKFTATNTIGDSILTESSGRVTAAGNLTATHFESNAAPSASASNGFSFQNGSSPRWFFGKLFLESGSNAGSDLYLARYNDAGGWIGDALNINRASGIMTLNYVTVGQTPTASNHLATKGYVDGAFVPLARTVTAGTGLSGGGALLSNISISANFGTGSGTITEGNDSRVNNGQTAFGWGNHAGLYSLLGHTHVASNITDFTSAARGVISGTGSISYNSGTGVISYSGPTVSGTTNYFPKFTGSNAIGDSAMQDTGSEININSSRNFAVEGVAAVRNILNVHNYVGIGKAGQHGAIVIHDVSSATPDASCAIDIQSTTRGLGTPQMTCAQKTAIASPKNGLIVYQTDLGTTAAGTSGYASTQTGAGLYCFNIFGWWKVNLI